MLQRSVFSAVGILHHEFPCRREHRSEKAQQHEKIEQLVSIFIQERLLLAAEIGAAPGWIGITASLSLLGALICARRGYSPTKSRGTSIIVCARAVTTRSASFLFATR